MKWLTEQSNEWMHTQKTKWVGLFKNYTILELRSAKQFKGKEGEMQNRMKYTGIKKWSMFYTRQSG